MGELIGGGAFIWQVKRLVDALNGYDVLAGAIEQWRLTHVLIKIADGTYPYNYDWETKEDFALGLVLALRVLYPECQLWGWQYVYGDNPMGEATQAIDRFKALDLDGFAINAEAQYKIGDKEIQAKVYMARLLDGLGEDVPIALSSYRVPSAHPIPWREFLAHCDIAMPQVYWMGGDPIYNLNWTEEEYQQLFEELGFEREMVYTGSFFGEAGWTASANEVMAFVDACQERGYTWNAWEMHEFTIQHPELLQAMLSVYEPPIVDVGPPPPDPPEKPVRPRFVGRVTGNLNVRTEPGALAPETDIGTLLRGSEVPVIRSKAGYHFIAGWVHSNWIEKL